MTKRQSRFVIELDDQLDPAEKAPSHAPARRGPMASAIADNAESLKERQALEMRIRKENDDLAHHYIKLKEQGLVIELVPLDHIACSKLIRDRNLENDLELDDLVTSIRDQGLSNAIRAERAKDGRYELIQGYRRLQAYKRLWRETGDQRFSKMPVAVTPPGDELEASYRKMVDENLVRRDVSFAEMAELARHYARDPKTKESSADKAVSALFKSAAYQKRSYIRAFAELLDLIGDHISFPHLIPRNLGLDLRRSLADEQKLAELLTELNSQPKRSAETELDLLRRFAQTPRRQVDASALKPSPNAEETHLKQRSFTFDGPVESGRCVMRKGRFELLADRDFASVEQETMEEAIAAFFAVLTRSRS